VVTSATPAERGASIERSVNAIGPRVREQRRVHGLSLQQTAALAGVSAASIHKVERGDMVPTITTLLKLASAFGLPLSSLVDDAVDEQPASVVVRAAERVPLTSTWPGSGRAAVTVGSPPFHLAGEVIEIAAGGSGELAVDGRVAERLWVVLDGTLLLSVGTDETTLRAGDSLQALGDRPLSWQNRARRVARALVVSVPRDSA
jgi:transcriptional regulator with XRE-family HTH domain